MTTDADKSFERDIETEGEASSMAGNFKIS